MYPVTGTKDHKTGNARDFNLTPTLLIRWTPGKLTVAGESFQSLILELRSVPLALCLLMGC